MEREQALVLNHLSQCADCREVAALMIPADAVMAEPAHVAKAGRWISWPILRWGALAAVLGAVTLLVFLHPAGWGRKSEISKLTPPPAPPGNVVASPNAGVSLPSVPPPAGTAQAMAQMKARESASGAMAFKKAPAPHRDLALSNPSGRLLAQQHATVMASIRPPVELREENAPAVGMSRRESLGDGARSVAAPPILVPAAPAGETVAASGQAGKMTAETSSPAIPHSVTQSVTDTAETQALGGTNPNATATGGNPDATPRPATAAKSAPSAAPQPSAQAAARASILGLGAFSSVSRPRTSPPAPVWSISSDGRVQRSDDGAKTFHSFEVAHGIKFQAVAARGNEVWAGGSGGALYHSTDSGATWTQFPINSEGNTITEAITAIQIPDPQHLIIITASGTGWVSPDGGQHWQKQP